MASERDRASHRFVDALYELLRQADRYYEMLPGGKPASRALLDDKSLAETL
jgi:hypothetical protein